MTCGRRDMVMRGRREWMRRTDLTGVRSMLGILTAPSDIIRNRRELAGLTVIALPTHDHLCNDAPGAIRIGNHVERHNLGPLSRKFLDHPPINLTRPIESILVTKVPIPNGANGFFVDSNKPEVSCHWRIKPERSTGTKIVADVLNPAQ